MLFSSIGAALWVYRTISELSGSLQHIVRYHSSAPCTAKGSVGNTLAARGLLSTTRRRCVLLPLIRHVGNRSLCNYWSSTATTILRRSLRRCVPWLTPGRVSSFSSGGNLFRRLLITGPGRAIYQVPIGDGAIAVKPFQSQLPEFYTTFHSGGKYIVLE